MYLECPLKFKLIYIDRIPQKPKPYFKLSNIIHSSLHYYYFYRFKGLDGLLRCYSDVFKSSGEKSDKIYQEGKGILINFYNDFQDILPYRVENKFKVRLGPYILSGKIDRVDKVGKGFELIDYKLLKNIPSQEEIKENLQLRIYSAGFYKLTRIIPIKASFYYLRYGQKISTIPTEDDIDKTIKLIYSVGEKIRRGRFIAKEGPFCRVCDYKDICSKEMALGPSKDPLKVKQLAFRF